MIKSLVKEVKKMRLLIVSDSHMQNEHLQNITNSYPDMDYYLHCGDSMLENDDPLLEKYLTVNGNHDKPGTFVSKIIFRVGKYKCLITHGNDFNVYYGYDELIAFMNHNDLDIAFHGHTHVPAYNIIGNKHIINPGSILINRGSYGFGTFAIVTITDDNIIVNYYHHTYFKECNDLVLRDGMIMLEQFKQILK